MDNESEIQDIIKTDHGFISHVFNFDLKSKQDIMNTIQYSVLAVLPVVLLNKTIQRVIPEADDNKASLELLAEIIAQLGIIFIGIFFIHRIITYFPTYSEANYESFSVINCVISFLIIIMSLQTKLGEKMNIITDRFLMMINGNSIPTSSKNEKQMDEYSVPILNNPISVSNQNTMHNNDVEFMNTNVPEQSADNFIMAANESLGGAFGSSF